MRATRQKTCATRQGPRAALVEGAAFALGFGWFWFADITRLLADRQPEIFHGSLLSGDCASIFALSLLGGLALFILHAIMARRGAGGNGSGRDETAQGRAEAYKTTRSGKLPSGAFSGLWPSLVACLLLCGAFLLLRHLPEARLRHLLPPAMLGLAAACGGYFHLGRLLRLRGTAIYTALSCAAIFSILWVIFFRLAPWPPLPFMAGSALLAACLCLFAPKTAQNSACPSAPKPGPERALLESAEKISLQHHGQMAAQIPGKNTGQPPVGNAPRNTPLPPLAVFFALIFFSLAFFSLGVLYTIQPVPKQFEWLNLPAFAAGCALGGAFWRRNYRPALALVTLALLLGSSLLTPWNGHAGGMALHAASGLLQAALFRLAADALRRKADNASGPPVLQLAALPALLLAGLFVVVNAGAIAAQLLFSAGAGLWPVALGAFSLPALAMLALFLLLGKAHNRSDAGKNSLPEAAADAANPARREATTQEAAGQETTGLEAAGQSVENAEAGLPGRLSAAEKRVAGLLAKGYSNPDICAALHLSDNTVRTHLKNIYRKTGANSRENLKKLLAEPCAPL